LCFPAQKAAPEPAVRGNEAIKMTALQIASAAFAAGFLTCMAITVAIIWWSFADARVSGINTVNDKRREQRTA
jgi:hypothetical protein